VGTSRHRDVVAYQLALRIANDVYELSSERGSFDRWTVGVQLVRAADSIGANIAEAFGRGTPAGRRRMLFITRGSLLEAEHWVDLAAERGLLSAAPIAESLEELARVLGGLLKSRRLHS
jgi:four helix bundle protein